MEMKKKDYYQIGFKSFFVSSQSKVMHFSQMLLEVEFLVEFKKTVHFSTYVTTDQEISKQTENLADKFINLIQFQLKLLIEFLPQMLDFQDH